MGGGAVKTIVLLMVLVVLSVLVGAQVSDSMMESMGAFAVIGMVVMGFLLLLLGKNSWYLVFLFPPVLTLMHLRILSGSLAAYAVAGFVLCYTLIQSVFLRQQKITWHKLSLYDFIFAVIVIYMCVSFYRFPVGLNMMGADVEFVGAEAYIHCMGAALYFICLSILSVKSEELEKILRVTFFVAVVFAIADVAMRLRSGNIYWGGAEMEGEEMGVGEKRITLLYPLAALLLPYLYACRPFFSLLCSPIRLAGILFSLYGISLAGARGRMIYCALQVIGISLLKKELGYICIVGTAIWGVCVVMSGNGLMERAPRTIQRMLSILPGVEVERHIELETSGSSDVRVIAWKMAFDTRAGYIKDYIWGDGYQLSQKEMNRTNVARLRGTAKRIGMERGNDTLARTGNWHNTFITTMHRLGIVGCVLTYLMELTCLFLFFRLAKYYKGKPFFAYFCALYGYAFVLPITFFFSAGTTITFFDAFKDYVLLKLLYAILREEGKIGPLVLRRRYVPLLIQEASASESARNRVIA